MHQDGRVAQSRRRRADWGELAAQADRIVSHSTKSAGVGQESGDHDDPIDLRCIALPAEFRALGTFAGTMPYGTIPAP